MEYTWNEGCIIGKIGRGIYDNNYSTIGAERKEFYLGKKVTLDEIK